MKRCPQCRRDYFDDSLAFCLDDGSRLLEGPSAGGPATEAFPTSTGGGEAVTKKFDRDASTNETLIYRQKKTPVVAIGAGAVLLLVLLGWAGYSYFGGQSRQIDSIAVMPFVNESGNPDLEYVSDGITESLINSLSQVPTLSVKARSSVFTYKGKDSSPQQVAKELAVQAVLNGRVAQRGDDLIFKVELVDAASGNNIWGDQYTRKITDIAQIQGEIARDVSAKLRAKLTGAEKQKVARNYTENTEAYRLYLLGRHHWNKRKPDDIQKSVDYFQQAIDKDPTYALAYAALAEAYILIPNYGLGPASESYPKARSAAEKAIEIDDSLAEPHHVLGSVAANRDWNFSEAEAEYRKAISLNPNNATSRQWYAEFLLNMGRRSEALAEMRRAKELDPLSLIINGMYGVTLRLNGQSDQAIEHLKKLLELDPNFPRTHLYLAETYQRAGRFEEAVDEFAKHFELSGGQPEKVAGFVAKVKAGARSGGEKGYSRAMAEVLETTPGRFAPPPVIIASYWAGAGELDKAFAVLENSVQARDDDVLMLKDDRFDSIKNEPRYKDLLRRVGLPE